MCGIAGIIGQADTTEILDILQNLQTRGRDATGVAFNAPASKIVKAGIDASSFVENKTFKHTIKQAVKQSTVCLLHTRQATHGSPSHNSNNHPLYSDKGIIIHNGIVNVTGHYESAIGETDSEQLLLAMDKHGVKGGLERASGSYAIAYQSFELPHLVYLYNHISPLVIGKCRDNIYFCSTRHILESAIGHDVQYFKTESEHIYRVNAKTMVVQDFGEVKPRPYHYGTYRPYSSGGYSRPLWDYDEQQEYWEGA